MIMSRAYVAALLSLFVAACGGGGGNDDNSSPAAQTTPVVVQSSTVPQSSLAITPIKPYSKTGIRWNGSANGEVVMDWNDEQFKVLADDRCVYSVAQDVKLPAWCAASASDPLDRLWFVDNYVRVAGHRNIQGHCVTLFVLEATEQVIDIVVMNGVFRYVISSVRFTPC